MGDNESKRKKYCLMCNVFKPERCHHCSACNRCVLNMDHHCPWVNNCIGFWNRKYFLLLLIYVFITTYYIAITLLFPIFDLTMEEYHLIQKKGRNVELSNVLKPFSVQLAYVLICLIAGTMTLFLKFHIYLVLENKTTLETLANKGNSFDSEVMRIYNNFSLIKVEE
jgi:hypothetical protein